MDAYILVWGYVTSCRTELKNIPILGCLVNLIVNYMYGLSFNFPNVVILEKRCHAIFDFSHIWVVRA